MKANECLEMLAVIYSERAVISWIAIWMTV